MVLSSSVDWGNVLAWFMAIVRAGHSCSGFASCDVNNARTSEHKRHWLAGKPAGSILALVTHLGLRSTMTRLSASHLRL